MPRTIITDAFNLPLYCSFTVYSSEYQRSTMAINTSVTNIDMDEFIRRVQSLPPELYIQIHDLTFKDEFPATCRIDRNYRPLSILQVNRKWRSALSPAFYDRTIFTVVDSVDDLTGLSKWIRSLPRKHITRITFPELRILSTRRIEIVRDYEVSRVLTWATHDLCCEADLTTAREAVDTFLKVFPSLKDTRIMKNVRWHFQTSSCGEVVFKSQ